MKDIELLIGQLAEAGIVGCLWVDGSFLTRAPDPNDADVLLVIPGRLETEATLAQAELIDNLRTYRKSGLCDVSILYEFLPDDPKHELYQYSYAYWRMQFGKSRNNVQKGIAAVTIGGKSC